MSHQCPICNYRFEDAESLKRHLEEGRGCPEADIVDGVYAAERI